MKGNESYTVFMGVNITVSNIFLFLFVNICASDCSIGLFLVLDRCLIACCVEIYAELLIETCFQESFVIHTNLPYVLICHYRLLLLLSAILLQCVYTVTPIIVFIFSPSFFCQWPHCRENICKLSI